MIIVNSFLLLLSLVLPGLGPTKKLIKDFPEIGVVAAASYCVLVSLVQVMGFCLLLSTLGFFSLPCVWGLILVSSVCSLYLFRNEASFVPFFWRHRLPLCGMVILAVLLFNSFPRPAQWLTNYHMDAGRYSNIASFILDTGSHTLRNDIPEGGFGLQKEDYAKFPGMFARSKGQFETPYLHLYPSYLAFVRGHVGLFNSLKANWFLGIISCFVMFLLVKTLTRSTALAWAALALLFSNAACQLYFNRNMTECISQLLFMGGFVFLFLLEEKPSRFYAFFAALAAALLAACRLEMGILYPLLPGCLVLVYIFRARAAEGNWPPKGFLFFLVCNLLFLLPLAAYYYYSASVYAYLNTRGSLGELAEAFGYTYKHLRPWGIHLWLAFVAVLLGLNLAIVRFLPRVFSMRVFKHERAAEWISWLVTFCYLAFLIWNYFFRPDFTPTKPVPHSAGFRHDTVNLIRLMYFVDPLCILVGVLGLKQMLRRRGFAVLGLFVVLFSCLAILKCGHTPPIFWWIRRYLPITIPGLYLLYVVGLASLNKRAVFVLLALSLTFNLSAAYQVTRSGTEKEGLFDYYQELATVFDDNDLQLCFEEDRCNKAAVPLDSQFGVDALYLSPELNIRKVQFIVKLLELNRGVLITRSSYSKEAFDEDSLQLLQNAGLKLVVLKDKHYSVDEFADLKNHWQLNNPLRKLYLPPTLVGGTENRRYKFPTKIYRVQRIASSINGS